MAITKSKYYNGELLLLADLNKLATEANNTTSSFIASKWKPFDFLPPIKEVPSASYITCSAWAYWGELPGGCVYATHENKIYQLNSASYKSTGSWLERSDIAINPSVAGGTTGSIGYWTGSGWCRYMCRSTTCAWTAYGGYLEELSLIRQKAFPATTDSQSIYSDQYISEQVVGSIYGFRGRDIKYLSTASTAYVDVDFDVRPGYPTKAYPNYNAIYPVGDKMSFYMSGSGFRGPMTFEVTNTTNPIAGAILIYSPYGKQTGDGYTVVDTAGLVLSHSLYQSYTSDGKTIVALHIAKYLTASVPWDGTIAEIGCNFTQHTAYNEAVDNNIATPWYLRLHRKCEVNSSSVHINSSGNVYEVGCAGIDTALFLSTSSLGGWERGDWINYLNPPYWSVSNNPLLTPHPANGFWYYQPKIIDWPNADGESLSIWKGYPATYTGSNHMGSGVTSSVSCSVMVGNLMPNYPVLKDTNPSASLKVRPYGTAIRSGSMLIDLQAFRCYPYTTTGSLSVNVGYLKGSTYTNITTLNIAEGAISSSKVKVDRVVFDAPYLIHNCSSSINISGRILGLNPRINANLSNPPYVPGAIADLTTFHSYYYNDAVKLVTKQQ